MPTPKQPNGAKKLPTCPNNRVTKPTVMYGKDPVGADSLKLWSFPVLDSEKLFLVLPMPTMRAAMAKKKWEAMSEGEKRFAIAKEIAHVEMGLSSLSPHGFRGMRPSRIVECCNMPDAILALIEGEPTP